MQAKATQQINSFVKRIQEFITNKDYKKIVLQLPKQLLTKSFDLVSTLKKTFFNRQFFILYDSLKQSCCNDTLGAQHVNYDCLIHFGRACFSSNHQANHYYIFKQGGQKRSKEILQLLISSQLIQQLISNNIGYVLVDQPYYQLVKQQFHRLKLQVQLLKLVYDTQQKDKYLVFGYYSSHIHADLKNILIVSDIQNEEDTSTQMGFIEKIGFTLKSLNTKVGQKLYTLGQNKAQPIVQQKLNNMKRLMQRYSIISKLQEQNTFGVLVSNTGTSFVNQIVTRCQQILKKHNKKCFLFMMNNLNEVKLGNFSEIEVYVVVSCYNNSLFAVKDFHKLVVTPTDLEIAFQNRNFDQYGFDLKSQVHTQEPIKFDPKISEEIESKELQKAPNQQIVLQNKIQTLDFYRQRQYKGLDFGEKKEIKKMTKGKIGLAQQYTNLQ